ncbi:MAG: P-type conjugative transfer protein TrbL [Desulfocapsaceae bacterium]|nr:P-type conjugative transfer protein TrbL [Desulfocapsaceae bacterium]
MRIRIILPFVVAMLAISASTNCYAEVNDNVMSQLTTAFYDKATVYGNALQAYAQYLFYLCLVLDVAIMGIKCVLSQASIADTIKQFCMILLFAGFIFSVITHYHEWTADIINGLSGPNGIGNAIGAPDINASPFRTGLNILKQILTVCNGWQPIDSLAYMIMGGIILFCYAMMTAQIVLILCESYIAMNAAVILLGFGGSSIFKDFAINTMRYALAVAFKLFVMQLVLGVGLSFINDFGTNVSTKFDDLFVLLAASIVLLALVKTLPEIVAGIITGSHTGSGSSLASSAAAVMAAGAVAATGGVAAARSAQTTINAARMANEQGASGFGKIGQTAKNLWASNQEARNMKNSHGSVGQRMSSIMNDNLTAARAANNPPQGSAGADAAKTMKVAKNTFEEEEKSNK